MNHAKETVQEKSQNYSDFFQNKLPKRLPVEASFPNSMIAQHGGLDPISYQYNYSMLAQPAQELCSKIYSDACPVMPPNIVGTRTPSIYQLLNSQNFVMGASGQVQHPEVVGMFPEEYPQLIERGFDFLVETVVPRQHKNLDPGNAIKSRTAFEMGKTALMNDTMGFIPIYMQLLQTFGYYPGSPLGSFAVGEAPLDFVADQLRSFSGMSVDLRRNRTLVKEACETVLPLVYAWAMPAFGHPEGGSMLPLHMPTFMREKDFVELYLPTFKTMLQQMAAVGVRPQLFCEDDWSRYLDILLEELPAGTKLQFEYGDPKTIKDKLGKKFIISGLFPVSALRSDTPQQIVDRAKRFCDIMLPGGGYFFGFDKVVLAAKDANLETWAALNEFLRDYMVYDNAGESFGTPLNVEGFTRDYNAIPPVKSDYLFDWKSFHAQYPQVPEFVRANFEKTSHDIFLSYMNLLI